MVKESEYIGQKSNSFLNRYYNGDITAMLSAYIENDQLSETEIDTLRPISLPQMISWLYSLKSASDSNAVTIMGKTAGTNPTGNADWLNDFALSVSSETPSAAGYILFAIWASGIIAMIILVIKSSLRLHTLQKSALPLQNPEARRLYERCLNEMEITKKFLSAVPHF